jgi:hypothetical protein
VWLANRVSNKVALTLPNAFYILEEKMNDPKFRQDLILAAIQPGGFDWVGFALSMGIDPEDLKRVTAEWSDRDVIIDGCIDAAIVAEEQHLKLEFVPSIAETTRVDLVMRPERKMLQVVISAPEDLVRFPKPEEQKEEMNT